MKRLTTEEFIEKAKQIHGNKYDYSKVNYINNHTRICIICPKHGEFWQRLSDHLTNSSGCPLCSKNKKDTKETFIKKARKIHGNKYDYSKVNYINSQIKVCIICPIHGEFWQKPACHTSMKQGCPECKAVNASKRQTLTKKEFAEKAKKVHGDKYDYSEVEYVNNRTKVCIICPIHGKFLQTPNMHLNKNGCPKCKESSLEKEVSKILEENKIEYISHYKCDWLGKQHLDFYLPKYNVAIECQGGQHFIPVEYFGGKKGFDKRIELDKNKQKLCQYKNIKLLYFSKNNYNSFLGDKVYHSSNEILNTLIGNE